MYLQEKVRNSPRRASNNTRSFLELAQYPALTVHILEVKGRVGLVSEVEKAHNPLQVPSSSLGGQDVHSSTVILE